MTREIKFRGKRIDNQEWTYGYFFQIWEQAYILWGTTNGLPNMIEVCPPTVGQFIGLKDKNGKEIYEGDVVRDVDTEKIRSVEYHGHSFMLVDENRFFYSIYHADEQAVIGNIHDKESEGC